MTDTTDEELDPPSGEIGKTRSSARTDDKRTDSTTQRIVGWSVSFVARPLKWLGIEFSSSSTSFRNGLAMSLMLLSVVTSVAITMWVFVMLWGLR